MGREETWRPFCMLLKYNLFYEYILYFVNFLFCLCFIYYFYVLICLFIMAKNTVTIDELRLILEGKRD